MEGLVQRLKAIKQYEFNMTFSNKQSYKFLPIIEQGQEFQIEIINLEDQNKQICEQKLKMSKNKSKLLQICDHPNILKCYDDFTIDNYYILKLERCEQQTLSVLLNLNQRNIGRTQYIKFATQILQALQYLYNMGLSCLELNLNHIILDKDCNIKLFNLVTRKNQMEDLKNNCQSSYKEENQFDNFSQQENKNYPQNEDFFKIGVFLYILAGGDEDEIDKLTQRQDQIIEHLQIDLDIKNILKRLINNSKQNDHQSFEELIQQFQQINLSTQQDNNGLEFFRDNGESIFNKVVQLFEQQKFSFCINILKQLIKQNPLNDKYQAWIGRSYVATKQLNEGLKWSLSSLELNPNNDLAYFNLGNIKSDQQNMDAIYYYNKSLEIKPQQEKLYFNLGVFYSKIQMNEKAIQSFKSAIKINPQYYSAYNNLGSLYETMNQFNLSILCFKKSIKISPIREEAYNNLGVAYYSQKKYDQAKKYFAKVLNLNHQFSKYQKNFQISKIMI